MGTFLWWGPWLVLKCADEEWEVSRVAGGNNIGGVGCCGGLKFGAIATGRETQGCYEVGWDRGWKKTEGSAIANFLLSSIMCRKRILVVEWTLLWWKVLNNFFWFQSFFFCFFYIGLYSMKQIVKKILEDG